jgi:enoyl-CoA hydratase/carnithine racemase
MSEQIAATPSLSRSGTVAVLSLGSGQGRFSGDSIAALHKCLDEVEGSDATALVTTAEGKIWSNGFDIEWLRAHHGEAAATLVATEKLFARVLTFPIPTVAAVGGHVFAGGVMLALSHDVVLMRADRGFLCLPEVDLGVVFTPGMTALLTARMTPAAVHRTMVLGARLSAPEAAALGIIADAVPLEELTDRAMATAGQLGGRSRPVVAGLKQRIYAAAVAELGAAPPDREMLDALFAATG